MKSGDGEEEESLCLVARSQATSEETWDDSPPRKDAAAHGANGCSSVSRGFSATAFGRDHLSRTRFSHALWTQKASNFVAPLLRKA